ncbi:carboxymuconolactone decarboxylase family protein [Aliihoeflea sp. PC F10.4]
MTDPNVSNAAIIKEEAQQLRSKVESLRGYWHPFHHGLLEMAPDYLRAYLDYQHAPMRSQHLEPKVCEFIYIAVDAAVSHLYEKGTERHIAMALEKGATPEEILEVIQLTVLSSHSTLDAGMSILAEELGRAGRGHELRPLTPAEEEIKQAYIARTGSWPESADHLFRFAPHFVRAFLAYGEIPYRDGPLPPKIKAFIGIALNASPVAPQLETLRRHIRRALDESASPEEICDVLQLASAIAIHSCTIAVPALMKARADM